MSMDESVLKDTAPIRAGEELDAATLEAYLRERLAAVLPDVQLSDARIAIEQFPGGHSNLTYLIRLGDREFILRRPPFGPVAPTAHDMPREYRLLAAIHPVFNLAPQPYLLCEDTAVIGVPFYLMERRRWLVIRREMPREIEESLPLRRQISEAMVDALAALHAVDMDLSGLAYLGEPVGFVGRQMCGWSEACR